MNSSRYDSIKQDHNVISGRSQTEETDDYCFADDASNEYYEAHEHDYDVAYNSFESDEGEEELYEEFSSSPRRRSVSQGAAMFSSKKFVQNFKAKLADKGAKLGTLLKEKQLLQNPIKVRSPFYRKKESDDRSCSTLPKKPQSVPGSPKLFRANKKNWKPSSPKHEQVHSTTSSQSEENILYNEVHRQDDIDNALYSSEYMQPFASPTKQHVDRRNNSSVYSDLNYETVSFDPAPKTLSHSPTESLKKTENNECGPDIPAQSHLKLKEVFEAKAALKPVNKIQLKKPKVDYKSKPSLSQNKSVNPALRKIRKEYSSSLYGQHPNTLKHGPLSNRSESVDEQQDYDVLTWPRN